MPDTPQPEAPAAITRAQAREIDRIAAEEYGLPTIVLMENAARALAAATVERARAIGADRVLVATGSGNNGGDGLAAARHLHNVGLEVLIAAVAPPGSPDSLVHWRVAQHMRMCASDWRNAVDQAAESPSRCIIVDALFGTGLSRLVTGDPADCIGRLNRLRAAGATIVSADVPSGLDADSGRPLGSAIRAHATVTFAAPKVGFAAPGAGVHVGEVVVGDLGLPREILLRVMGGPPGP